MSGTVEREVAERAELRASGSLPVPVPMPPQAGAPSGDFKPLALKPLKPRSLLLTDSFPPLEMHSAHSLDSSQCEMGDEKESHFAHHVRGCKSCCAFPALPSPTPRLLSESPLRSSFSNTDWQPAVVKPARPTAPKRAMSMSVEMDGSMSLPLSACADGEGSGKREWRRVLSSGHAKKLEASDSSEFDPYCT